MSSNSHTNQVHIEDNPEFFGGEMQPYIEASTKTYEQKSSTAASCIIEHPVKKMIKISAWRKFVAFFSFL